MPEGFQFLDIIFFAMLAAFIALRLRSVLGRRTENEQRSSNSLSPRRADETSENVVRLPEREKVAAHNDDDFSDVQDPVLARGLKRIKEQDPNFNRVEFVQGARAAFEMIVDAFAAADNARLRPLLNDSVYELFSGAIEERTTAGEKLETTLVGVRESEIVEAGLRGGMARVTVRFVSDQINLQRDSADRIVEGDPGEPTEIIDLWTFGRDTRSHDPNWQLAATRGDD